MLHDCVWEKSPEMGTLQIKRPKLPWLLSEGGGHRLSFWGDKVYSVKGSETGSASNTPAHIHIKSDLLHGRV